MFFNKKKVAFYYDEETCTYHKAEFRLKRFLGRLGAYAGVTAVMCLIGLYIYSNFLLEHKGRYLEMEQQDLISELQTYNETLDKYESSLDDLLRNNNNFYIPIIEGAKISQAFWKAGRGGTDRYADDATLSTQIENRFELMDHRIDLLKKRMTAVQQQASWKSKEMNKMPCILPIRGNFISGFGTRHHPITGYSHIHTGLDFACEIGSPVYATGDGIIEFAGGNDNGYGIHINLDHGIGYVTKYAHLSRVTVSVGQNVNRGDIIGYSGNTGRSTGPHLHYELIHNGLKIDPIDFIYSDLLPTEYLKMKLVSEPMH